MNNVAKSILIFVAGAVTAIGGLYLYGQIIKSKLQYEDEEYDEEQENEEEYELEGNEIDNSHLPDIHEYARQLASKRSGARPTNYATYHNTTDQEPVNAIFAITEEEYKDADDENKIEYTWYADGYLIDDSGEEIDLSEPVGNFFVQEVKKGGPTTWEFYAKDSYTETYYYVSRDLREWKDDVEHLRSKSLRQIAGDNDDNDTGEDETDEE